MTHTHTHTQKAYIWIWSPLVYESSVKNAAPIFRQVMPSISSCSEWNLTIRCGIAAHPNSAARERERERGGRERAGPAAWETLGKITQPHLWTHPMTYIAESSIKKPSYIQSVSCHPTDPPPTPPPRSPPPTRPHPHHHPTALRRVHTKLYRCRLRNGEKRSWYTKTRRLFANQLE